MRKIPAIAAMFFICFGSYLALRCEEKKPAFSVDTITLSFFYSGELLGEIEPCGCSGKKLGGMSLRSSWINHLKSEQENLYLIDGGFASPKENRQSEIKFSYYRKMLRCLGYQYCFLRNGEKIPAGVDAKKMPVFIGSATKGVLRFQVHRITACGYTWKTLFLAIEGDNPTSAEIKELLKKISPDVVFVMTRNVYQSYTSLVPPGKYTVIVLSTDAQEPFSPMTPRDDFFVISAGNRGRYGGLLQLTMHKNRLVSWKNDILPLEPRYSPNMEVLKLQEEYKRQVKNEHLLERRIKQISPVGYVGTEICRICHEDEYKQWSTKAHAHAFKTLEDENYHYDPECVGCHVVGYEYEEGFRTLEDTPHLVDVGCESCHGPGAEHVVVADKNYGKTRGKDTCMHCHAPNRSPHFKYDEYRDKIKHWRD